MLGARRRIPLSKVLPRSGRLRFNTAFVLPVPRPMLKWLLAIVVIAVVSGLGRGISPGRWRIGHLPGDLHFHLWGRHIHIPFTSTLLMFAVGWLLLRWL